MGLDDTAFEVLKKENEKLKKIINLGRNQLKQREQERMDKYVCAAMGAYTNAINCISYAKACMQAADGVVADG